MDPFAHPSLRFPRRARVWLVAAACATLVPATAQVADSGLDAAALRQIEALGAQAGKTLAAAGARVEVEPGRLDPRLRLAPCDRVEVQLPPGARAWGRTRVGLRCAEGPTPWHVYLPVTVRVFARAWVAAQPLPAGTVLRAEHLVPAEVDWAAERIPPLADPQTALGRALARALAAGQALRQSDLTQRQWFAAGEKVQVLARGAGFTVTGEAQALGAGNEGQPVRVRTDAGQVLSGTAIGPNRVEVLL